jgi:hypothetical protein
VYLALVETLSGRWWWNCLALELSDSSWRWRRSCHSVFFLWRLLLRRGRWSGQEAVVVVGACWSCSPAAEAAESIVVELILDINPSKLQGDISEVDCERGRCHYMQKNQHVLDIWRTDWSNQQYRMTHLVFSRESHLACMGVRTHTPYLACHYRRNVVDSLPRGMPKVVICR